MWSWIALCCVVGVGAVTGAVEDCDVTFDGNTYRRETALTGIDYAVGLAVDFTHNTLYFSHFVNGRSQSAKFDFHTKSYSVIKELTGYCMFAVDQVRGEVHAGCRYGDADGLYKYNVGRFVLAGEEGRRVEFVHYYNDTLYYSPTESFLLHTFREARSERVHDVPGEVRGLVVDSHGDLIYYNETGVYWQRAGSEVAGAARYEGIGWPRALAVDRSGAAYVCDYSNSNRAIYRLEEHTQRATRVVGDSCFSVTVDRNNNIIYGDEHNKRIVRLVKC